MLVGLQTLDCVRLACALLLVLPGQIKDTKFESGKIWVHTRYTKRRNQKEVRHVEPILQRKKARGEGEQKALDSHATLTGSSLAEARRCDYLQKRIRDSRRILLSFPLQPHRPPFEESPSLDQPPVHQVRLSHFQQQPAKRPDSPPPCLLRHQYTS